MTFDLDKFLTRAQQVKASDIHLNCHKVPSLRINGEIFKIADAALDEKDIRDIFDKTLPKEYKKNFDDVFDIDYIYDLKGVSRYRVNFCKDINYAKFTFRVIPYNIKGLAELNLPEYLGEFTKFNNGLVLVSGATGSGKSTTLAALIEIINQNQKKHIISIEDPVEFIHEDKKSILTQRSLDINVPDFKTGMKYALRQDPDIILLGEIRDKDTLLSTIEAAETGHLVFSTVHTNGTVASINRLKGLIEESAQEDFMHRIANCVRGIIHQQLVPIDKSKNKILMPALEILTFTPTVVDYVQNNKLGEIYPLMQRTTQITLQTMNSSLYKMYQQELITKETALERSFEKVEMEQMIKGMFKENLTAKRSVL